MNKTLSMMAAAVLLASTSIAPAFAQTSPAPASPAPAATPAAPMAPSAPAAKPADSAATPAAKTGMDTASASGGYITEQASDQISANDYIGKSVYNADNKSIGDVNDLLFKENGGIVAAVIGVGGFLGIGEKDVAVPIEKITTTRDAKNNDVRLTTTETAEALQAAPQFKTLADKQAETDKTTTSSTMPAAGGTTSPSMAPATPAAPSK